MKDKAEITMSSNGSIRTDGSKKYHLIESNCAMHYFGSGLERNITEYYNNIQPGGSVTLGLIKKGADFTEPHLKAVEDKEMPYKSLQILSEVSKQLSLADALGIHDVAEFADLDSIKELLTKLGLTEGEEFTITDGTFGGTSFVLNITKPQDHASEATPKE